MQRSLVRRSVLASLMLAASAAAVVLFGASCKSARQEQRVPISAAVR
jgi:hypothetical protein